MNEVDYSVSITNTKHPEGGSGEKLNLLPPPFPTTSAPPPPPVTELAKYLLPASLPQGFYRELGPLSI